MELRLDDPKLTEYAAAHPGETIEIITADGKRLGTFTAHGRYCLPPGVKSPFTVQELDERRKSRTGGRPLADVLRDLQGKHDG